MEISNRYHSTAFCAKKQKPVENNALKLPDPEMLVFEPYRGTLKIEYSPDSDTFKIRGSLDKADFNTDNIAKEIEEAIEEVKSGKFDPSKLFRPEIKNVRKKVSKKVDLQKLILPKLKK